MPNTTAKSYGKCWMYIRCYVLNSEFTKLLTHKLLNSRNNALYLSVILYRSLRAFSHTWTFYFNTLLERDLLYRRRR